MLGRGASTGSAGRTLRLSPLAYRPDILIVVLVQAAWVFPRLVLRRRRSPEGRRSAVPAAPVLRLAYLPSWPGSTGFPSASVGRQWCRTSRSPAAFTPPTLHNTRKSVSFLAASASST